MLVSVDWPAVYLFSLRYTLFIASILFMSKAISVSIDYRTNKASGALTTVGMCFFTSCYTFSIFLTTFGFSDTYADNIMPLNYITGFVAYYFYTLTIEGYLKIQTKFFTFGQYCILFTAIGHLVSLVHVIFNQSPLLSYLPNPQVDSWYFDACKLFRVANTSGTIVGGIGSLGILLTLIIIFKKLRANYKNEKLLFWGVLTTGVVSLNDTFLGLGYLKYSFPLYFLGNTLEAIRFSNYYKAVTINIINSLKSNLDQVQVKYQSLVQLTSDWIWEIDTNYVYTYLSSNVEKFLGYTNKEILGQTPLDFMPEDEKIRILELMKETMNKQKAFFDLENKCIHKDGHTIVISTSGEPILNGQGELTGYRGTNRDITEQKKAEKEKEDLQSRLMRSKKMEALGLLAGGVAHDLNNVLSGTVTYPELLLMDLPQNSPLREAVSEIRDSGKKAAAIVEDLLTLARRGVIVTEVINLNQIVKSYIGSPEYKTLQQFNPHVTIRIDLDSNLLNIAGSSMHLFKTIMNLVNNAAEAMRHGGEIVISTQSQYIDSAVKGYDKINEGDFAVLTVTDSGIGIDPKDIERIFEPFYTKKTMGRSGTGLGMAVVWGTVKDHSGYIDVQSAANVGTIFTLYFPATREKISNETSERPIEEFKGNGESILVIDDIEGQLKIARALLNKLDYIVTTVTSGEEAVEYLKNHSVNLIILDMIMDPGMDGCETYEKIIESNPGQRAIIASGFSETKRVKKARELGAGEYIKKPYTLEKLGLAIKKELKRKTMYPQNSRTT